MLEKKRRLGAIWRWIRLPVIAYCVVLVGMMFFEERLIFFPRPYDGGPDWNPAGLKFEDAFFESADGTQLHGWYCPVENPRLTILFAHGNAGNLARRAPVMQQLQISLGASVMVFDYRGYGRSEGKPSELGVLADARAARTWLAEKAGIAETDIVLMGRSLGGGVVVDLAARDGARALIIESTFTSLPDVAAVHYPWLPVRGLMRSRLDSLAIIAQYSGPLFQSHGDEDELIPHSFGQQLHDAAIGEKEFYSIKGSGHNKPQPLDYYVALRKFLDKQLP